jgi:hypothetical protein
MFVALNRPPGCGDAIGMMLSGFDGSPGGLGLIDATSKVMADVASGDGACADDVAAVSRITSAKIQIERPLFVRFMIQELLMCGACG